MKNWQADLLEAIDNASSKQDIFARVISAAHALGFEYCAYGLRCPLPASRPRWLSLNNYPTAWQAEYEAKGYFEVDPTIQRGMTSSAPLVWGDALFASAPMLWRDAQAAGLRAGWTRSARAGGTVGLVSLVRSGDRVTRSELEAKQQQMTWLAMTTHWALMPHMALNTAEFVVQSLTQREKDVVKRAADGMTAAAIAVSLNISIDTVHFHTKNAVRKLGVRNKTAAAVKAAWLGWLS